MPPNPVININPLPKKSNRFFISSTTIIASLIILVILFIIIYNSYIYPLVHQNKLQLTQDLFNSYINTIKSNNFYSDFILNYKSFIVNINFIANKDDKNIQINIKFLQNNKTIHEINKSIEKTDIIYSNDQKYNLDINYNDLLKINYNYIFNRYNIIVKNEDVYLEGRFKIKCSNSPFICNTNKYKIFRKLLIDNKYSYDNIFGINEHTKILINNKKKIFNGGTMFNFINNEFIDEYLLINIINDKWILYFLINKMVNGKYSCYIIIKNQCNEQILYCGYLNKKLKFFHSINVELNIGSNIRELKFKFYSENLWIDFNTNNIKNSQINANKLVTSIDLNINYDNTVYKSIDNIFIFSNKSLDQYKNILLSV